ncbi:MAG: GGDEF domain-containing protein [Treponema sp.]|nr:GGDEF domain-containing protein [Treponema sp.]
MNETDKTNFMHFLSHYHEGMENPCFIVEFNPRGDRMNCIVQVNKEGDIFSATLQELSYLLEMLDKTIFENRKYHEILGSFNSYFFTFDGNRYRMQNTKDLTDIFEGSEETFRNYFVDFFRIDIGQEVSAKQVSRLFEDMSQKITDKGYRLLNLDGETVYVQTKVFSTREKTEFIALISTNSIIKDDNLFVEKFDGLTNLYNKKTVTEMISNKINISKQPGSLFIIDVDKFKECNDVFGHAFGDKVLVAVSKIIQEAVSGHGFAGRIGGDEFICYVDKTEEYDVRNIARDIRLGIQWAIPAINPNSVVTSSMGIVRIPQDAATYEDAFKLADKCLYIAKDRGRNCYVIYRPELHDPIIQKNDMGLKDLISGKSYADNVNAELEILDLLSSHRPHFRRKAHAEKIVSKLIAFLQVHKLTVFKYDGIAYNIAYTSGHDEINFRQRKLSDNYFRYFNAYGFFQADNINVFDTVDKEKYDMYLTDKVSSTLEVLCKKDDGSPNILVCYDVFKPAQTFPKQKIVFGIMAARILAEKGIF